MVTEKFVKELVDAGVIGGGGNAKWTDYFKPFANRVEHIADTTYVTEDPLYVYLATDVIFKATSSESAVSTLWTEQSGYKIDTIYNNGVEPTKDGDGDGLNKRSMPYGKDQIFRWNFYCKLRKVAS